MDRFDYGDETWQKINSVVLNTDVNCAQLVAEMIKYETQIQCMGADSENDALIPTKIGGYVHT